jgi:hypothetical protein
MKLTSIYVKRLPNGLLYLGKTEEEDPFMYKGSGLIWNLTINHNNYAIKDIETWILHQTNNKEDLKKMGIYYSKLFDVVNSKNWANLTEEEGQGGAVNKDKIVINKNHLEKKVSKEELFLYIKEDWKLGRRKKSRIHVYKEDIECVIQEHEVETFLKNGWKRGLSKKHVELLAQKRRKGVEQYDKFGNFIKEYSSIKEAVDFTKIHNIASICKGKRKCKNFIWKYKKNINE